MRFPSNVKQVPEPHFFPSPLSPAPWGLTDFAGEDRAGPEWLLPDPARLSLGSQSPCAPCQGPGVLAGTSCFSPWLLCLSLQEIKMHDR